MALLILLPDERAITLAGHRAVAIMPTSFGSGGVGLGGSRYRGSTCFPRNGWTETQVLSTAI